LWPSIVADVLNRPLRLPAESSAAYGAALIVAIGIGAIEATPEAIESVLQTHERIEPNTEAAARYEILYDIYRDCDRALGDITARLFEFERN
jgi:xylulokinase